MPRRPNDLPHRPLILCSNLPNAHGYFDEVLLEFKTKFRKTKMTTYRKKFLCICLYKYQCLKLAQKIAGPTPIFFT